MLIASIIALQVIIFVGLIVMFRRIMTQNVVLATRHIDELSQEYTKKEDEVNRQRDEIRQKSQEIVTRAQEEAATLKEQTLREAEQEKDKILKQARHQSDELIQQADRSRQLLIAEIDKRIEIEAIAKACELVQDTLPGHFMHGAHSHWVEDLVEHGFQQIERLRIPEEVQDVHVVSAFPLTDPQREKLLKRLKGILGRDLALKERVDTKMVAGLVISIGSLVLDGSLKNKIQERAKSAREE